MSHHLQELDQLARAAGLEHRHELLALFAREAARRFFRRNNPGAGPAEAETYAGRYWRAFREEAAETAAILIAVGETGQG